MNAPVKLLLLQSYSYHSQPVLISRSAYLPKRDVNVSKRVVAVVNKTVVKLTPVVMVSKFMIWPRSWENDLNWEKTWLHTAI